MADSVALPQPRAVSLPVRILALIPGILMLGAVGFAGKLIEQSIARYGKSHHVVLPNIEYVLWAILIGLIISNTIGVPAIFRAGVATYEFWLKVGIVLLGARFLIGDVLITRKRRLPRARMPCFCISRWTRCLPTRMPRLANSR